MIRTAAWKAGHGVELRVKHSLDTVSRLQPRHLVCVLLLLLCASVAWGASAAWTEARALYDQGKYAEAIVVLDRALATTPDDVDLLWLKAAALERGGHARGAVVLYESTAHAHPDWVDRMQVDYANALVSAGRADDAATQFRAALARDPKNADALRGFARMLNDQGHNRAAAAMYRAQFPATGAPPSLLTDLAWTDYWAGRPDRARADLERAPRDASARRLSRILDREIGSGPTIGWSFASDSDNLDVRTITVAGRGAIWDGRAMAHTSVRHDHIEQGARTITYERLGWGLEYLWSDVVSTHTFASVRIGPESIERIFADGWLTVRPTERLRFDLAGATEPILTVVALDNDVRVTVAAASADWRVTPRWSLGARGARNTYSDDNTLVRLSADTRLRVWGTAARGVSLTASGIRLTSDRSPGTGYYAPERYVEAAGGLLVEYEPWTAFVLSAHGRLGVLQEKGSDSKSFGTYEARADGMLAPHTFLSAGVSGGDSNLSSPSGYSRTAVWAELGARF